MKKIFSFIISAALGVSICTPITVSAQENNSMVCEEYLYNPNINQYCPVRDVSEEISRISSENKRNYEFEKKFEEKRYAEKISSSLAEGISKNNASRAFDSISTPVPGGVGYGKYYTSSFQSAIGNGTTLSYDIVCPTKAGGDVSSYLYLTSTNRAAKGVEAFIAYYSQNNLEFKVFDWARPENDRWKVTMSYSDLSDYLSTKIINNSSYQVISIQNRTEKISSTQWRNNVWLWNYSTLTYDSIYSYDYNATASDQYDSHYGSWGPIVEAFQDYYSLDTNVMGFYLAQIQTKDNNNTWGSWQLLSTSNSTNREDSLGFSVVHEVPNHTFLVH